MAARREITKNHTPRADEQEKARMLDVLVDATGWTRDHARRAIRAARARRGPARDQPRRPRPREYSYDAPVVLQEVWRLSAQPCGRRLAANTDDTWARLVRDRELGKVAHRITDTVLDELRAMSPATIDRHLKPPQRRHPPGGRGVGHPGLLHG